MPEKDEQFMREALKLARKLVDRPSSEPRAGAVLVLDGQIIARSSARDVSAITFALDQVRGAARRATIYTNIEPCLDATDSENCILQLIEAHPARIVIGAALDQSPEAAQALNRLKDSGIEIATGVCEEECRQVNEIYLKYHRTGLPFVTVKFAQSLDGRIATATGDSQWISSPASLRLAHQLRREHDAIMVGIGTVLVDDPRLTVRLVNGRDPLRIIIDSHLRIPITARVLADGAARHTLIATTELADRNRLRELEDLGAEVMLMPAQSNPSGVNLIEVLKALGQRRVASVLVEGGAGVITSLMNARRVDRMVVAIAPKIIGRGVEAIGDLGIIRVRDAITFSSVKTRRLGSDIIFDGRVQIADPLIADCGLRIAD